MLPMDIKRVAPTLQLIEYELCIGLRLTVHSTYPDTSRALTLTFCGDHKISTLDQFASPLTKHTNLVHLHVYTCMLYDTTLMDLDSTACKI